MERLEMSDTPRTDEVLRIADNWGAIRDAAGGVMDGVLPEEAHADMVTALERLARTLERELAEARGEIAGGAHDSANYPDSPVARLKAALDFVCENEGELHGRNYLALVKLLNPSPARRVEPGCGLDCSCRWPTDEKPGFSVHPAGTLVPNPNGPGMIEVGGPGEPPYPQKQRGDCHPKG
jgi:hypothetical protein